MTDCGASHWVSSKVSPRSLEWPCLALTAHAFFNHRTETPAGNCGPTRDVRRRRWNTRRKRLARRRNRRGTHSFRATIGTGLACRGYHVNLVAGNAISATITILRRNFHFSRQAATKMNPRSNGPTTPTCCVWACHRVATWNSQRSWSITSPHGTQPCLPR